MSIFKSVIDLSFQSTAAKVDVRSGAFSARLSLDRWAKAQEVQASFLPHNNQPGDIIDFEVAIVGGIPLPSELEPSDMSRYSIYEDDKFLCVWMPLPEGVLYVWDFENMKGVMWCITQTLRPWLLGRPILPLINAFSSQTEWCPLHASAVGRHGEFILMVGAGRAGKSTAALSCASAGWQYAGDDFVLINPTRRLIEPVYTSARLRKSAPQELTDRLSSFVFAESNDYDDPKFELRFGNAGGGFAIEGGVIRRIIIPRRRGGVSFQCERAKPGEVFAAMMTHTRLCVPGRVEQLTRKLLTATGMLPSHFVDTGQDVMAIPAGLQSILDDPS